MCVVWNSKIVVLSRMSVTGLLSLLAPSFSFLLAGVIIPLTLMTSILLKSSFFLLWLVERWPVVQVTPFQFFLFFKIVT